MPRETEQRVLATNRRARHEYEILERFEAGVVLDGTEVKSVRDARVQLKDSYVEVIDGEAWLVGVHVSAYGFGNRQNHEPERRRKLLLHRKEIDKIYGRTAIQGQTCVPLSMYLKANRIKVEVALARGRKLHDKRQVERQKQLDKEAREAMATVRRR
jgi:SsrA-binding protein